SDEDTHTEVIAVISGGFATGGPSTNSRKAYVRNLDQVLTTTVENDPFPTMTFTNEDRRNVVIPHDDALVVEMKITNMGDSWVGKLIANG
ncbi:hypothetical protein, partial [Algibacter sp. L4_22]|uniref:hypothetical protein n=1 Tax=Algibacter sp. L4_22 TaxID=2942477 RepID=UPI00201B7E68